MAARVQFDPGGPKFVTTLASRTPVSAQPQLDVIHRHGYLGGRLFTRELACYFRRCLRWDFLCNISAMLRCELGAHKGPLHDYACVRSEYTKGQHTVIDE